MTEPVLNPSSSVQQDSTTGLPTPQKQTTNAAWVAEQGNIAGLRGAGTSNEYLVAFGNWNVTRLDIDTTETLVTNAPCLVGGVFGNDGNTGYTDLIDALATGGGSAPKFRINCGDGVNPQWLGGVRFEIGLCVDGESAGHDVSVIWRPLED